MIHQSLPGILLLDSLLCLSLVGCGGAGPLRITKYSGTRGPWCAPNQRVQIGERVVGKVAWGQDKWKNFLLDDTGKEHDPQELADQAWSYLERTGDAPRIMEAYHKDGRYATMTVVSIKPVVVILETGQLPAGADRTIASPERSYWLAQVSSERDHPAYKEGLQWFSPDLKQRPTSLAFSQAGVAEIPLVDGKLKLVHEGAQCKTTRE
jgi:hypothetical protein